MSEQPHWPHHPTWDCLCCGRPWPCDPAREELMRTDDSVTRSIYLSVQLHAALQEMPTAPAGELYERFLGWTHAG